MSFYIVHNEVLIKVVAKIVKQPPAHFKDRLFLLTFLFGHGLAVVRIQVMFSRFMQY